jgi:hypothetical protein
MSKALYISAAIAMAFSSAALAKGGAQPKTGSAAISESTQFSAKDCETLSAGSARSACMRSATRSSSGDAAAAGRAIGSGGYWHGAARASGVLPPDKPARPDTGIEPSAAGGTGGSGAQAEGRLNLKSDIEVIHSGPDVSSAEPQ